MVCGVGVGWPDWTGERVLDWIGLEGGGTLLRIMGIVFVCCGFLLCFATSSYVCFEYLLEHIDAL